MEVLKKKIVELRKKVFAKEFVVGYNQAEEDALKAEVHQLMKEEPNKKDLAQFWNDQFTGNFNG